ncbi:hypothetical protein QVD99_007482 [Batrachochytrium dendrobatidis]|nr:hypothetical protein O5D80_008357 [Batrachochytrium dendrobatidis]KAK5665856.1 hypothetical protein QVD99_007482 [Batrachochytrium dendrobatidis]
MANVSFYSVDAAVVMLNNTLFIQGEFAALDNLPVRDQIKHDIQVDRRNSIPSSIILQNVPQNSSIPKVPFKDISNLTSTLSLAPVQTNIQEVVSLDIFSNRLNSRKQTPPRAFPVQSQFGIKPGVAQCRLTKNTTWSVVCLQVKLPVEYTPRIGCTMHLVASMLISIMGCVVPSIESGGQIISSNNSSIMHPQTNTSNLSVGQVLQFVNSSAYSLSVTASTDSMPMIDPSQPSLQPTFNSTHLHRYRHSSVWDPIDNRGIVFGGIGPTGPENSILLYDLATQAWSILQPINATLPISDHASFLVHPYLISCFGQVYTTVDNQLLPSVTNACTVTDINTWIISYPAVQSNSQSSHNFTEIDLINTTPSARTGVRNAMVFIPILDAYLVFGGGVLSTNYTVTSVFNDVWSLHIQDLPDTILWIKHIPDGEGPSPRLYHSVALLDNETIMVWGGIDLQSRVLTDGAYFLNFKSWTWSASPILTFQEPLTPDNTTLPRSTKTNLSLWAFPGSAGYIAFAIFLGLFAVIMVKLAINTAQKYSSKNVHSQPLQRRLRSVSRESVISYSSINSQLHTRFSSQNAETGSLPSEPTRPLRAHVQSWCLENTARNIVGVIAGDDEQRLKSVNESTLTIPPPSFCCDKERPHSLIQLEDWPLVKISIPNSTSLCSKESLDKTQHMMASKSKAIAYPCPGTSPTSVPVTPFDSLQNLPPLVFSDESRRVSTILPCSESSLSSKDFSDKSTPAKPNTLASSNIQITSDSSIDLAIPCLQDMLNTSRNHCLTKPTYHSQTEDATPSVRSMQWIPFEYGKESGFQDFGHLSTPAEFPAITNTETHSPAVVSPEKRLIQTALKRLSTVFSISSFSKKSMPLPSFETLPFHANSSPRSKETSVCFSSTQLATDSNLSSLEPELQHISLLNTNTTNLDRKRRFKKPLHIQTQGLFKDESLDKYTPTDATSRATSFWQHKSKLVSHHSTILMSPFSGPQRSKSTVSLVSPHTPKHPLSMLFSIPPSSFVSKPESIASTSPHSMLLSPSVASIEVDVNDLHDGIGHGPMVITTEQMKDVPCKGIITVLEPHDCIHQLPHQRPYVRDTLTIRNTGVDP